MPDDTRELAALLRGLSLAHTTYQHAAPNQFSLGAAAAYDQAAEALEIMADTGFSPAEALRLALDGNPVTE